MEPCPRRRALPVPCRLVLPRPGRPGSFSFWTGRAMTPTPIHLSARSLQTADQPISYFMQQAVENPHLISLAAGLVDPVSLPAAAVRAALDEILARPAAA